MGAQKVFKKHQTLSDVFFNIKEKYFYIKK